MKNISTGFGLCVLGLGIAAWPVLDRLMPQANAVGVGSVAPAVAAAALAHDPPGPTIVWYQAVGTSGSPAVGLPAGVDQPLNRCLSNHPERAWG
jgi:hypothetical protein